MQRLFQVLDAAQVVAVNLLRGLQDARVPMVYALLCYWGFGLTLSWLLLDERLYAYHWAGIALIATGLWLATAGRRS